jgi:SEC-C motif
VQPRCDANTAGTSREATEGVADHDTRRILLRVSNLIDSGWAAWLPFELIETLEARSGGSAARRSLRRRLERGPSEADRERWERFRLVCPSRIDLPAGAEGLTVEAATAILDELGLLDREPEPVELVLTLDDEELRELERTRSARDLGAMAAPDPNLPSLDLVLGGGKVGRNDPCPCGSGKKFKRCHGR